MKTFYLLPVFLMSVAACSEHVRTDEERIDEFLRITLEPYSEDDILRMNLASDMYAYDLARKEKMAAKEASQTKKAPAPREKAVIKTLDSDMTSVSSIDLITEDSGHCPTSGEDMVYEYVDEMPEFPGGYTALRAFIAKNLRWPQNTGNMDIEGFVVVSFQVDTDGKIVNPQVLRDLCTGLGFGEEAIKMVKLMPAWVPGKLNGKLVKVRYKLPVRFGL